MEKMYSFWNVCMSCIIGAGFAALLFTGLFLWLNHNRPMSRAERDTVYNYWDKTEEMLDSLSVWDKSGVFLDVLMEKDMYLDYLDARTALENLILDYGTDSNE